MGDHFLERFFEFKDSASTRKTWVFLCICVTGTAVVSSVVTGYPLYLKLDDAERKLDRAKIEKETVASQLTEAKGTIDQLKTELAASQERTRASAARILEMEKIEAQRRERPIDEDLFQELSRIQEMETSTSAGVLGNRYVLDLDEIYKNVEDKNVGLLGAYREVLGIKFGVTNTATKKIQSQRVYVGRPVTYEIEGRKYRLLLTSCTWRTGGGYEKCRLSWARE